MPPSWAEEYPCLLPLSLALSPILHPSLPIDSNQFHIKKTNSKVTPNNVNTACVFHHRRPNDVNWKRPLRLYNFLPPHTVPFVSCVLISFINSSHLQFPPHLLLFSPPSFANKISQIFLRQIRISTQHIATERRHISPGANKCTMFYSVICIIYRHKGAVGLHRT